MTVQITSFISHRAKQLITSTLRGGVFLLAYLTFSLMAPNVSWGQLGGGVNEPGIPEDPIDPGSGEEGISYTISFDKNNLPCLTKNDPYYDNQGNPTYTALITISDDNGQYVLTTDANGRVTPFHGHFSVTYTLGGWHSVIVRDINDADNILLIINIPVWCDCDERPSGRTLLGDPNYSTTITQSDLNDPNGKYTVLGHVYVSGNADLKGDFEVIGNNRYDYSEPGGEIFGPYIIINSDQTQVSMENYVVNGVEKQTRFYGNRCFGMWGGIIVGDEVQFTSNPQYAFGAPPISNPRIEPVSIEDAKTGFYLAEYSKSRIYYTYFERNMVSIKAFRNSLLSLTNGAYLNSPQHSLRRPFNDPYNSSNPFPPLIDDPNMLNTLGNSFMGFAGLQFLDDMSSPPASSSIPDYDFQINGHMYGIHFKDIITNPGSLNGGPGVPSSPFMTFTSCNFMGQGISAFFASADGYVKFINSSFTPVLLNNPSSSKQLFDEKTYISGIIGEDITSLSSGLLSYGFVVETEGCTFGGNSRTGNGFYYYGSSSYPTTYSCVGIIGNIKEVKNCKFSDISIGIMPFWVIDGIVNNDFRSFNTAVQLRKPSMTYLKFKCNYFPFIHNITHTCKGIELVNNTAINTFTIGMCGPGAGSPNAALPSSGNGWWPDITNTTNLNWYSIDNASSGSTVYYYGFPNEQMANNVGVVNIVSNCSFTDPATSFTFPAYGTDLSNFNNLTRPLSCPGSGQSYIHFPKIGLSAFEELSKASVSGDSRFEYCGSQIDLGEQGDFGIYSLSGSLLESGRGTNAVIPKVPGQYKLVFQNGNLIRICNLFVIYR